MPKIPFYKPSIGAEEIDEVIVALPEADSPRAREIGAMLHGSRPRISFVSTWPVLRPLAV